MPTYYVKITSPSSNTYKVEVSGIDLQGQSGNVPLQWQIDESCFPAWSFVNLPPPSARGIEIKNPGNAFTFASAGARTVTWTRNAPDNVLYDYTLSVTNNNVTLIIDPSIINRP